MAKLTTWQRDKIRGAMLRETFAPREAALLKREAALAVRVILDRYGRDAFARFDAVPTGWLTTAGKFLVGRGNANHYLRLEEARALPHELAAGRTDLDPRPKLAAALDDLLAAQTELRRERDQLNNDVRAALLGFGTEAALRDGWPEAYAHLAVPAATPNLPAVRVEDLNRRIAALKEAA